MRRTCNIGTVCHKQAYYQVFQSNMILQFSTDYSCFNILVQTVPHARRARLSHRKNILRLKIREAKDGNGLGDIWGTTLRNTDEELKAFWGSMVLREYRTGDYTRRL